MALPPPLVINDQHITNKLPYLTFEQREPGPKLNLDNNTVGLVNEILVQRQRFAQKLFGTHKAICSERRVAATSCCNLLPSVFSVFWPLDCFTMKRILVMLILSLIMLQYVFVILFFVTRIRSIQFKVGERENAAKWAQVGCVDPQGNLISSKVIEWFGQLVMRAVFSLGYQR